MDKKLNKKNLNNKYTNTNLLKKMFVFFIYLIFIFNIISFIVSANNPPFEPSNPYPANQSTNISINTILSWTGGDPDGDPVTYDVYFGTNTTPPLVVSNQSETNHNPGTLQYGTQYYWKIIAWDNQNETREGDIWDFTTQNQYTLIINIIGNGIVTVDPDKPQYIEGDQVEITATADPGWEFTEWSVDLTGSTNPTTITMNSNKTVTATFTQNQYILTINIIGNGTVNKNPDQISYPYGTIVTLTANPDPGWVFNQWSVDLTGSTNPTNITMDENKTVAATFTQNQYTLTINTIGNGTVNKNPDQTSYPYGTIVTLTANPDTGWNFDHWSGDLTGNQNPTNITMNSNKTINATFTEIPLQYYTLTINIVGNGNVTPPSGSIYLEETIVELEAIPDLGWTFNYWSGGLTGNQNPTNITINNNKTVSATFTQNEYILTNNTIGKGAVNYNPNQTTYHYNDVVTLTAIPDPGWTFNNWSGDLNVTANPANIIMNSNKTVIATFLQNQFTLTINKVGNGIVIKNLSYTTYSYGTVVQLTALPDKGWSFDHWSRDLSGKNNPENITIYSNKTVTVHFTIEQQSGQPPSYEQPNNNPVANASAGEPYIGFVNEEIIFDGSLSYDPDEGDSITQWLWYFGDGKQGTGEKESHIYSSPAEYIVILIVTDKYGAKDDYEAIVKITQPNYPPSIPEIKGPTEGKKNTVYNFSAVSTDADNDTIKYTFVWDNYNFNQSMFLPSGTSFYINHSWAKAGKYTITVIVTDGKTDSSSMITVYIDVHNIGNIGFLIDLDSDGRFDIFHNTTTDYETSASLDEKGNYLIDTDGDNNINYVYNLLTKEITPFLSYESEESLDFPIFITIFVVIIVFVIIIILLVLFKSGVLYFEKKL